VTVSPDGKSVYVASQFSSALVRFTRNTTTGAITQAGCISETGAGPCADGHGLAGASSVTVSPDGQSVYVGASGNGAVVRLNRNTTSGAITQPAGTAGCISEDGSGPCADGHALLGPSGVAVSPNGKTVYAATRCCMFSSGALVRFDRNTTTGAITEPAGTDGCIGNTAAGPCVDGRGLAGANAVTVSPDGNSVYVAASASGAVARFNRTTTTGAITQPADTTGCVSETGSGPCADGRALAGANSVAVSPGGKSVYVASHTDPPGPPRSDAVVRFDRAP
jgi:DNA-binding beta-propeller fold protein YncE